MARRLVRAVLFVSWLLSPWAWCQACRKLARALRGGADRRRRPDRRLGHPDQAIPATAVATQKEAGTVERMNDAQFPIGSSVAPEGATPAPPIGPPPRIALLGQPAPGRWEDRRELLLRAIAADAPRWEGPPAFVVRHQVLRLARRHAEFATVPGFVFVVTVPSVWSPALWC